MRRKLGKKGTDEWTGSFYALRFAGPLNVSADDVTTVEYLFWGNQSEINTIMGQLMHLTSLIPIFR